MNTPPRCLRCGQQMELGFVPGEIRKVVVVTRWVAGQPEPSFWRHTRIKGKEQRAIISYRCPGCGLLESYATEIVT